MKEYKEFITTNYNNFFEKHYFMSILKNIIKIGNLNNTKKIILDFGCGQKIVSKILKNVTVLNYDIKPEFSDHKTYKNLKFDVVIFNHVLMYLYPEEISKLFDEIKNINSDCEIILGLSKQNIISKIGKFLTGNPNAHDNTRSSYKDQVDILFKKSKLIKKKFNVFFMTDIYYSRF